MGGGGLFVINFFLLSFEFFFHFSSLSCLVLPEDWQLCRLLKMLDSSLTIEPSKSVCGSLWGKPKRISQLNATNSTLGETHLIHWQVCHHQAWHLHQRLLNQGIRQLTRLKVGGNKRQAVKKPSRIN